jgi:hypothetical protein
MPPVGSSGKPSSSSVWDDVSGKYLPGTPKKVMLKATLK